MPLEIVTIPCLSDNYAFLAHDAATGCTGLVDVPEAEPILAAAAARGWSITDIFITHHHWDHIGGLNEVLADHKAKVIGASADYGRLPPLDQQVSEGDVVNIGNETGTVIDVSGHTVGHVAYHFADARVVFTADSLMALGCGRVFEGTFDQMWQSLSKLAALPEDTLVCSGHEYTQANARFAETIEPGNPALTSRIEKVNAARADGASTVPSLLSIELETNPFLRPHSSEIRNLLGLQNATDAEVFAEVRRRKDAF